MFYKWSRYILGNVIAPPLSEKRPNKTQKHIGGKTTKTPLCQRFVRQSWLSGRSNSVVRLDSGRVQGLSDVLLLLPPPPTTTTVHYVVSQVQVVGQVRELSDVRVPPISLYRMSNPPQSVNISPPMNQWLLGMPILATHMSSVQHAWPPRLLT